MTKSSPLALVSSTPAVLSSRAARLRANQEAQKAEAQDAIADLIERAATISEEAKDLSTLECYTPKQREALTALGINTAGSIAALSQR